MRTLIALILLSPLSAIADHPWHVHRFDDIKSCATGAEYNTGDSMMIALRLNGDTPEPVIMLGNDKWNLPENMEGDLDLQIDKEDGWVLKIEKNAETYVIAQANWEILKQISLGKIVSWRAGRYTTFLDLNGTKRALDELASCITKMRDNSGPYDSNPFREAIETNPFDI